MAKEWTVGNRAGVTTMSGPKAPTYEEVAAYLNDRRKKGLPLPSVREIKATLGGRGSLSTYKDYRDRWAATLVSGSGLAAIIASIRAELAAYTAALDLQLMRLERAEAAKEELLPAGLQRNNQDHGEFDPQLVWGYGDEMPFAHQVARENALFEELAQHSHARFLEHGEDAIFDLSVAAWHGRAELERSALVPTTDMQRPHEEALLSRHDADGFKPVLALVPKQPMPGESNTYGGSIDASD